MTKRRSENVPVTAHIPTHRQANLIGGALMVAAMAAFAVEDALLKSAAQTLPVAQVLALFGLGGAVLFAAYAVLTGQRLFRVEVLSRPMQLRVVFEITGRLFYMLAIALTPLSAATVILQATPIVVVASAALLFGERVGWRRWMAVVIGLCGVVLIVRPGANSFSALSLLAVLGMLGFAGRDLASRAAPASLGIAVLGFYGFLSLIAAGLLYSLWEGAAFVVPATGAAWSITAAVVFGVVAYASLMKAMRTGEVAAVTPLRYSRLLFGVGLGVVMFGETLDPAMLAGSGLIVLSGLFILWRGRSA